MPLKGEVRPRAVMITGKMQDGYVYAFIRTARSFSALEPIERLRVLRAHTNAERAGNHIHLDCITDYIVHNNTIHSGRASKRVRESAKQS